MIVKVNISIAKDVLDKLDEAASEEKTTRSGLLSRAVLRYLEEKEDQRTRERRRHAAAEIDRIREQVGPWDGTAEVLKWRELH